MPLEAGKLRHRIKIERPVITQDQNTGAPITDWAEVATVWASINPMSARDLIAAQAEASKVMGRITIRYRNDLTEAMRLVHESKGHIYNIEGILADPDSGLEYLTIPVSLGVKYQEGDGFVPVLLESPTIGGIPEIGEVIEVTDGIWANNPTSYSYQWHRGDEVIEGATNSTYLLTDSEEGFMVYCVVTATNEAGSVSANTADFGPIVDPMNIYLPEAEALFARMVPEPDNARKALINSTIVRLIDSGFWSGRDVIYVTGMNKQHSLQNWRQDAYHGTLHGAEDFIPDRGFKGDGATTYIETDFNPFDDGANYSKDSGSCGGGLQDSITNGTLERAICGLRANADIVGSGLGSTWVRPYGVSNFLEFRMNTGATHVTSGSIESGSHWALSRNGTAGSYKTYKNGNVLSTASGGGDASLDLPPRPMTFRFMRFGDHGSWFSNARHSYFFIGGGLTDQQMEDFYYIMNEYLAAIGAEDRVFPPVANANIFMDKTNLAQNDEITYTLVKEDGTFTGSFDIVVEGDLDDSDFDVDFTTALQAAVDLEDGVTFDGVKTLTFTEDFDGNLSWSRTLESDPAEGLSHIVRLENSTAVKIWKPYAAALCGNPAPVTHPKLFGWNNSGFEFNTTLPPSDWTFDFAVERGFNVFRMPYKINRVQPDNFGEINGADAAAFKAKVDYARSIGAYVILDPHDYGGKSGAGKIGSDGFPIEAYFDHLIKMSDYIGIDDKIIWCLMNEPVGLPQKLWWRVAQSSVDALRVHGFYGDIQIPGTGWTGAHSWVSNGNAAYAEQITDPLDYHAFDVHQYFDSGSSGTVGVCEVNAQNRLNAATSWANTNGKRLFLGETGMGDPDVSGNEGCATVFPAAMDILLANPHVWDGIAGWGYSDRWTPDYPFRALQIDPDEDPDTDYMDVMRLWFCAEYTDIADCALCLEPDDEDTITHTGGSVSQWNDKSAEGNNVTQSNGSNQFQWGSSYTINGRRAMRARDGISADRFMDLSSGLLDIGANPNSVFAVLQTDANNTGARVIGGESAAGRWHIQYSASATQMAIANRGNNSGSVTATISTRNTGANVIGMIWQGGSTATPIYNMAALADLSGMSAVTMTANLTVGRGANILPVVGLVGDVVAYRRAVTASERNRILNRFRRRWGTP